MRTRGKGSESGNSRIQSSRSMKILESSDAPSTLDLRLSALYMDLVPLRLPDR